MERLPYQPSFLAVRDPEVNRALYELYQTIAIAVNQISDSGEQVRRTGIQVVASPGVGPQGPVGPVGPPGPAGGGGVGTKLWAWNGVDLTQFSLAYIGGGGPWTVADVTAFNNTDNAAGQPYYDHISNLKFFNPAGSAANVFFLYSTVSVVPAAGELLYVIIDFANAAINTTGIIVAKPGTETTDNYRLINNNTAFHLWKAVAGVGEVDQAGDVTVFSYTGHWWSRVRLVLNTSGVAIGGISAGGMNVYQGSIPVYKKTMKVTNATVLSGAVKIGVRFLGNAGLGNVYGYISRMAAYSAAADFEQFF
jgi:hypothetical protein